MLIAANSDISQFIIFSDDFSYFEGDIWARCLGGLMVNVYWLFYEEQSFKRGVLMNFLSMEIQADQLLFEALAYKQSTHLNPYLLIWAQAAAKNHFQL